MTYKQFKNNISILIQGPIHPNLVSNALNYSGEYPLIISTWASTPEDEFRLLKNFRKKFDGVTILINLE